MKPIYWLFWFILFGLIILETQYSSLVYNQESKCTERVEKRYDDYEWFKKSYNELLEKNRWTYTVTYDTSIQRSDWYNYTVRRTITCYNSLQPNLDYGNRTLIIVGCGVFTWVDAVNFIKK